MTATGPPDVESTDPDAAAVGRSGPGVAFVLVLVMCALALGGALGWRIGHEQADPSFPGTGSVEVGFFQDMSTHHNQAIGMASIYLQHGTDPFLLQLASEILTYQSSEIGIMGEYLHRWGESESTPEIAMQWMSDPKPREQMDGLATPAEMEQLKAARGTELDDLFTRLMIIHHAGGIHMADFAARFGHDEDAVRWAKGMADAQRSDIGEMNRWRTGHGLAAIDPGPWVLGTATTTP
jgi:uncharacterized protein (DUF305 family)